MRFSLSRSSGPFEYNELTRLNQDIFRENTQIVANTSECKAWIETIAIPYEKGQATKNPIPINLEAQITHPP